MISSVWVGEGGMPGLGSMWPAATELEALGEVGPGVVEGDDLGAGVGRHLRRPTRFSLSVSFASKAARFGL